jgi:hypothetical protein
MPAIQITNYSELQAATIDWLNRGDLVDQVPAFITMTTAQFNREMRLREMMQRADATSDQELVEVPNDFLEVYSLMLAPSGTSPPLRYISERDSNILKAKTGGLSGPVAAYTIIGNTFELIPPPGGNVDLKLVYYARIPDLSDANPTNWLLTRAPDLYLYSTLLQAEPYLKNDQRMAMWLQLRAAIIEGMRIETEAALRPRSGFTARAQSFY